MGAPAVGHGRGSHTPAKRMLRQRVTWPRRHRGPEKRRQTEGARPHLQEWPEDRVLLPCSPAGTQPPLWGHRVGSPLQLLGKKKYRWRLEISVFAQKDYRMNRLLLTDN